MKCDLIIFDLDGTLCDTAEDIATSVNLVLHAFGRPELPVKTVTGFIGHGVQALLSKVFDGAPPAGAFEKFMEHYRDHCLDQTRLYSDVRETLAALPGRKAVLSNKPEGLSKKILEGLGVAGYFARIAGGDTFPTRKPDPGGVRALVRDLGSKNPIIVGDSVIDIQTACAAGIPSVAVLYGYSPASELIQATCRIRIFADLLDLMRDNS